MKYILSDLNNHHKFFPLTFTKSVVDIRCGILTIKERWETLIGDSVDVLTQDYLQKKYSLEPEQKNIIINASILPDKQLLDRILNLEGALLKGNILIAYSAGIDILDQEHAGAAVQYSGELICLEKITDIFSLNAEFLNYDFDLITKNRESEKISVSNTVFGKHKLFVESGCFVECSTINTNDGPVYIGKGAKIMEGSHIRGGFALCENAELKMGSKVYGATTIGPKCKVGGEINNSVFFSFSNKAHDGFLGNSVIGEWCNIGADSNNSNLKNNYELVKLWDFEAKRFLSTGLQFCGLIMGDHSKCGINTMFNTGTVVGVSSNLFGSGFPRNYIPSFLWGGSHGYIEYKFDKAIEVMEKVMARRDIELSDIEREIFSHIFNITQDERKLV